MNVREQLAHYKLTADQVMDMAGQIAADRFKRKASRCLESPEAAGEIFKAFLAGRTEEVFAVAFLDTRHRVMKLEALFRGTIDGATVYPRVVAERALRYAAAAVIVGHNHPSGISDPSLADHAITRHLKDALALLDVRLLDHFVIGEGRPASMAAMGLIGGSCGFAQEETSPRARKRQGKGETKAPANARHLEILSEVTRELKHKARRKTRSKPA